MSQYGWDECLYVTRDQVSTVRDGLLNTLEDNLVGVYLHGSLTFGCFNPRRSDVDLLAVTAQSLSLNEKRQLAELLLTYSVPFYPPSVTRPIEISLLHMEQHCPWQYPTPFDFHYSEQHRERYTVELANGEWQHWNDSTSTDPDLAAHITIILTNGICLYGESIDNVFPGVPQADYVASLLSDARGALHYLAANPVYSVLSLCRVAAFMTDGLICSKDSGAIWALDRLPAAQRSVTQQALAIYRGTVAEWPFDASALDRFAAYMTNFLKNSSR